MHGRVKHLVVDSGAFIKNSPVHEYAECIYTVESAVKEIKDKETRQRLQFLPYELKVKEPSTEIYKYVTEFSKKTGDYGSLSATDLQIIALTYQLEKEYVGTEHLNKEPSCQVTGKPSECYQHLGGFYYPESDEETTNTSNDDEGFSKKSTEERSPLSENDTVDSVENDDEGSSDDNSDDDSSDESWITPQNITDVQKKMGNLTLDLNDEITVACVTTDFSIQNVLLQMGLHVVSINGMLIKNTKVFILRCYACFKTTNIMTKVFCPSCGNKTLKRVAVYVNSDGSKSIHINFKRRINIRGTKYSLPKPQGGKHANNPILCEDQPIPHNRPAKLALQKVDVFSPGYEVSASPFATRDVYSRAATLGIYGKSQRTCRKNPNEWSKRTGNRKKK